MPNECTNESLVMILIIESESMNRTHIPSSGVSAAVILLCNFSDITDSVWLKTLPLNFNPGFKYVYINKLRANLYVT